MARFETLLLSIGRLGVILAVVVSPWLLGGVQLATQRQLALLMLGVLVALSVRLLQRHSATLANQLPGIPVLAIPMLVLLILAFAQATVPIDGLHGAEQVVNGFESASVAIAQPSLYPRATMISLVNCLTTLAVFIGTLICFQSRVTQKWACTLIALNGAAIAFFGIMQKLTWNGKIFWTIELTQGGRRLPRT